MEKERKILVNQLNNFKWVVMAKCKGETGQMWILTFIQKDPFVYVALWDPGFLKFQQEFESCPLDWKTTIRWNDVSVIFQHNHVYQGCWKNAGPTFQCIIVLQSRGQGPEKM